MFYSRGAEPHGLSFTRTAEPCSSARGRSPSQPWNVGFFIGLRGFAPQQQFLQLKWFAGRLLCNLHKTVCANCRIFKSADFTVFLFLTKPLDKVYNQPIVLIIQSNALGVA